MNSQISLYMPVCAFVSHAYTRHTGTYELLVEGDTDISAYRYICTHMPVIIYVRIMIIFVSMQYEMCIWHMSNVISSVIYVHIEAKIQTNITVCMCMYV